MAATERRKGGRHSKGDRKFIGFRMEATRAERLASIARHEGITVNDLVADLVDQGMGTREHRHDLQEALPLGRLAS